MGRTPRRDEQAGILHAQNERITAASQPRRGGLRHHGLDDGGLQPPDLQRLFTGRTGHVRSIVAWRLSLLTALDLPWVADGHQRDGPQVREPVDNTLRELLLAERPALCRGGRPGRTARGAGAGGRGTVAAGPHCAATGLFTTAEKPPDVCRRAGTANAACPSVNGP
jgi:hypothetical protein